MLLYLSDMGVFGLHFKNQLDLFDCFNIVAQKCKGVGAYRRRDQIPIAYAGLHAMPQAVTRRLARLTKA